MNGQGLSFGARRMPLDGMMLPSRQRARAALEAAIEQGGAVLVTGEAGSGKSWLLDQTCVPSACRSWLRVDLGPTTSPADLLGVMHEQLGLASVETASATRLMQQVRSKLQEFALEGRSCSLILDEAHVAGPELLEQIRTLIQTATRDGWLSAIVLAGQTSLLQRLRGPSLAGLDACIAERIHLRPIDADEAIGWLAASGLACDLSQIERWHRDSQGNPVRFVRLLARSASELFPELPEQGGSAGRPLAITPKQFPAPVEAVDRLPEAISEPLIPTRPPLELDEEMIEVGWADSGAPASLTANLGESAQAEGELDFELPDAGPTSAESLVTRIDDPYAALQAQQEWKRQVHRADDPNRHASPMRQSASHAELPELPEDDLPAQTANSTPPHGTFWAEPPDQFAPFGDLFRPRSSAPQTDS